jgi:hypothetical protein
VNVTLRTSPNEITSPFCECCPRVCRLGGERGAKVYGTGVHPRKSEQDIDQEAIPVELYDRPEGAQTTRSF